MFRIWLVSENQQLKSRWLPIFTKANYEVMESGYDISKQNTLLSASLIIFDSLSFPDHAYSLFAQIKISNPSIPIIVVIGENNTQSIVRFMRAGAINVLVMPVDRATLIECVNEGISYYSDLQHEQSAIQQAIELLQSLSSRKQYADENANYRFELNTPISSAKTDILQVGELTLHTKQKKVFYQNRSVKLTDSQFSILVYLIEHKSHVVSFEDLYFRLHGNYLNREAARVALVAHLSYLRTKLSEMGCKDYLVNIRGHGYLIDIPNRIDSHADRVNLDLMLEQLPVVLWRTNPSLRITSVAGAGLRKLELKAENIIGQTLSEFFQIETERSYIITAHQQVLRGESVCYEQGFMENIFQLYIEPSYSSDGEIIGSVGLAFDITERKNSEEVYQLLVNHSLHGLFIYQANRFVFANPMATQITGYTTKELLALEEPDSLIYEKDRAQIYDNIQKRLAGEDVPSRYELRLVHKDGSLRWVEQNSYKTVFRGQPAIQTTITDRTPEKKAVEMRHQLEEIYRMLAKNLPQMGVLLFDQDLRYLIVEGQILEQAGYTRNNMEGKTVWEVLPDQVEALLPYYRSALSGQEVIFEWISNNKTYEIQTTPVRNETGQIVAGMFLIQDITRHKHDN